MPKYYYRTILDDKGLPKVFRYTQGMKDILDHAANVTKEMNSSKAETMMHMDKKVIITRNEGVYNIQMR